jgi:hypothetical protein
MRSRHSTIAAIVVAIAKALNVIHGNDRFTKFNRARGNSAEAAAEGSVGFVERVKREFAELNGVDVSKVLVNFQIIG